VISLEYCTYFSDSFFTAPHISFPLIFIYRL
jgi:hypothetical protein